MEKGHKVDLNQHVCGASIRTLSEVTTSHLKASNNFEPMTASKSLKFECISGIAGIKSY